MAFIPWNHTDTIQRLCFYNQKTRCSFFLLFFQSKPQYFIPPQCKIIFLLRYSCSIDCNLHAFHFYGKHLLTLLLHTQLISDVTCRWLVNSWNTWVCFFLTHCIPVSTNWRSVLKKEWQKWNETDWKQALCCWCHTERDLFILIISLLFRAGTSWDIRGLMRLIQVHKLLFEATDGIILGASTATITQWSDVYAAL